MARTSSAGFYFDRAPLPTDVHPEFYKAVCTAMDIAESETKINHAIGIQVRLVDFINDNRLPVRVFGIASNTGAADFNQRLSEVRAWNVIDLLETLGVDPDLDRKSV